MWRLRVGTKLVQFSRRGHPSEANFDFGFGIGSIQLENHPNAAMASYREGCRQVLSFRGSDMEYLLSALILEV